MKKITNISKYNNSKYLCFVIVLLFFSLNNKLHSQSHSSPSKNNDYNTYASNYSVVPENVNHSIKAFNRRINQRLSSSNNDSLEIAGDVHKTIASNKTVKEIDVVKDIDDRLMSFDYVPVLIKVGNDFRFDMDVIIDENDVIYLGVQELFDNLMIYNTLNEDESVINGFFTSDKKPFIIDYKTQTIEFMGVNHKVKGKLKMESDLIILDAKTINNIFNIKLDFDFRSLSMKLESFYELPIQRLNRLNEVRSNISKLQSNKIVADTVIDRTYHKFKAGVFDWTIASTQSKTGLNNTTGVFALGAEVLYGQADFAIALNTDREFDKRSIAYRWKWVDNKQEYFKQVEVGRIAHNSEATIIDPYVGASVSNISTEIKKAEGFYYMSEYTQPDWDVELYINDVLVAFTKADGSGFYTFKVPNVFGTTRMTVKYYGPNGEERFLEKTITNSIVMLPKNKYEYKFNTGFITDTLKTSYLTKGEINYGLIKDLTVGGGVEYINYKLNNILLPFIKSTYQVSSFITLTGKYTHGFKGDINLNLRLKNNANLDINYLRQAKGQTLNTYKYNERRMILFSMPYKFRWISGFSRIKYTQTLYSNQINNLGELTLAAYYKDFSLNSKTDLRFYSEKKFKSYLVSDLTATYRFKYNITVSPTIQYNSASKGIGAFGLNVDKRIKRGNIKLRIIKNDYSKSYFANIGASYRFDHFKTAFNASTSSTGFSFNESAGGSVLYGKGEKNTYSNNSATGRGGIIISAFVDVNHNKVFDEGEKKVSINSIRSRGGEINYNLIDSIIKISNLNPFIEHIIQVSNDDLDVISWRYDNEIFSIMVDPNQFKTVSIPILPVGEIVGGVTINGRGKGRMLVDIYEKGKLITQIQSESDGYVYYLGLKPGNYVAKINKEQLENLKYLSFPNQINFNIKESYEGDMIDGIDFELTEKIDLLDSDE